MVSYAACRGLSLPCLGLCRGYGNSLLISVRTEFMRLIVFAFTLAPSWPPPKEGSFCDALPQPTVVTWSLVNLRVLLLRSARVAVFCPLFGIVRVVQVDVLRARKRSSERTAMALIKRTETGGRIVSVDSRSSCVCLVWWGYWCTLEETSKREE